ncbi:MAG: hypothetical protein ACF8XB_23615 [Planctomycetota bacterium JB042]
MNLVPRALVLLALVSPPLAAGPGGFADGDLYLYTRAATGVTFADGGLISVDPSTGTTALRMGFDHASLRTGAAAFDPHRKRIVFAASIDDPAGALTYSLFATDAAGDVETLLHPAKMFMGISPAGDGRIYLSDPYDVFTPFRWLDGANRLRTLYAADGTTAFTFPGFANQTVSAMTYDPTTNALFVAVSSLTGAACGGGGGTDVTIRKVPLSADGTRVAGPIGCVQVDVDPVQATERPVNWSRGPNGTLLLVVDNVNVTDVQPRMLRVDPATLQVTPFASNGGYLGAADGTAGAYSSVLGKAVLVDTRNDVLRTFAAGETGAGTVVVPSGPLSWNPGSNEVATLLEVDLGPCGGAIAAYGAGSAGTGGFVPALTASGCPAVGGALALRVEDVVGGASGFLMVGLAEGEVPFAGGALLVDPIVAAFALPVGGAPGVGGAGTVDVPVGVIAEPALAGVTVVMQAGFVDAGTGSGVVLTQGLRLEFE